MPILALPSTERARCALAASRRAAGFAAGGDPVNEGIRPVKVRFTEAIASRWTRRERRVEWGVGVVEK